MCALYRRLGFDESLALLCVLGTTCTGRGIDGKYYNSASGEYAMELAGGKGVSMQGQDAGATTYELRGNSLIIREPEAWAGGRDGVRDRAGRVVEFGKVGVVDTNRSKGGVDRA